MCQINHNEDWFLVISDLFAANGKIHVVRYDEDAKGDHQVLEYEQVETQPISFLQKGK